MEASIYSKSFVGGGTPLAPLFSQLPRPRLGGILRCIIIFKEILILQNPGGGVVMVLQKWQLRYIRSTLLRRRRHLHHCFAYYLGLGLGEFCDRYIYLRKSSLCTTPDGAGLVLDDGLSFLSLSLPLSICR